MKNINISVDNRPIKTQQNEWFETCKDWEIEPNLFLNPYDNTEFRMQKHIYKIFKKWRKSNENI
tara:strand:+ start:1916 stop:2107 length:192 start_codon:yes stop_codon:yes gene_type:complete